MIIYSYTNKRNDFYFLPRDIDLKLVNSNSIQHFDLDTIFKSHKIVKIKEPYPFVIKNCFYVIKLSIKDSMNFMIRREFKYSRYIDKHYTLFNYKNRSGILMYNKGVDLTKCNVVSLTLWIDLSQRYIELIQKGIVHGDIKLDNLCISLGNFILFYFSLFYTT